MNKKTTNIKTKATVPAEMSAPIPVDLTQIVKDKNGDTVRTVTYSASPLSDDPESNSSAVGASTALTNKLKIEIDQANTKLNEVSESLSGVSDTVNSIKDQIENGEIGGSGGASGNGGCILIPNPISPVDTSGEQLYPTLKASPFKNAFEDDPRKERVFQVAKQSNSEWTSGSDLKEYRANADSFSVIDELEKNTPYMWRCRDISQNRIASGWSVSAKFTTGNELGVATPEVTIEGGNTNVGECPVVNASAFDGGDDSHESTDWYIYKSSDPAQNPVFTSLEDKVNKTSIKVGKGYLQEDTEYIVKCRYKGAVRGYSAFGTSEAFRTAAKFTYIETPVVTIEGGNENVIENPRFTGSAFKVVSTDEISDEHVKTVWTVRKLDDPGQQVWTKEGTGGELLSVQMPLDILQEGESYEVSAVYHGNSLVSGEGKVSFTTRSEFVYIAAPTLSVPGSGDNSIQDGCTLTTGAFTVVGGDDTHEASDWIVKEVSTGTEVVKKEGDTSNLTSFKIPGGTLKTSTQYEFKVRHKGRTYGYSNWTSVTGTTASTFSPINIPDLDIEKDSSGVYEAPFLLIKNQYETSSGEPSDTLAATRWEIVTDPDNTPIFDSNDVSGDKYRLQLEPGKLQAGTKYRLKARFKGYMSGYGPYGVLNFTTQKVFYNANKPEPNNANIDRAGSEIKLEFSVPQLTTRPGKEAPTHIRAKFYNKTKSSYITSITTPITADGNYFLSETNNSDFALSDNIELQVFYKSNAANDDTGAVSDTGTRVVTINNKLQAYLKYISGTQHRTSRNPRIVIEPNYYSTNVYTLTKVDYEIKNFDNTRSVWKQSVTEGTLTEVTAKANLSLSTPYNLHVKLYGTKGDQQAESSVLIVPFITSISGTIGEPGKKGFGVGTYTGDDLSELKLSPMEGCYDPESDNYGNYQHEDGSNYVFIPAFYYKFDSAKGTNGLNIVGIDEYTSDEEAAQHGFIRHRAFIDGGKNKSGFFIGKYIASRGTNGSSQIPLSVKNGKMISLITASGYTTSSGMSGCSGNLSDALVLAKKVGASYHCETAFQASALAMLALCHGQYATDTAACAWYDAKGTTNYPKGCNNNSLGDYNDSSVKYTKSGESNSSKPLAGSGTPFAKTTHNGQANGVADVNGSMWQVAIGCGYYNSKYSVFKESVAASSITKDNVSTASNYDNFTYSKTGSWYKWGVKGQCCFYKDTSGVNRALCGVLPPENSTDNTGTNEFGQDGVYVNSSPVLFVAGYWNDSYAGVFYRYLYNSWTYYYTGCGFRVAAYGND